MTSRVHSLVYPLKQVVFRREGGCVSVWAWEGRSRSKETLKLRFKFPSGKWKLIQRTEKKPPIWGFELCCQHHSSVVHCTGCITVGLILRIVKCSDSFILTWGNFSFLLRETSIGCFLYVPELGIVQAWTGDQNYNLVMCPDWELNLQPLVTGRCSNHLTHSSQGF